MNNILKERSQEIPAAWRAALKPEDLVEVRTYYDVDSEIGIVQDVAQSSIRLKWRGKVIDFSRETGLICQRGYLVDCYLGPVTVASEWRILVNDIKSADNWAELPIENLRAIKKLMTWSPDRTAGPGDSDAS